MYLSFSIVKYLFFILSTFAFQEGDLLFQDVDCGPFCEAIEKVTQGYNGANLSHVGMIVKNDDDQLQVIEATTKGVILTDIDAFLKKSATKSGSKVLVGRLKSEYTSLIPEACTYAKTLLGKEYDQVFDVNNDTYYCSELVYESYKVSNDNIPIFDLQPMTFVDPDTGETFGIWTSYYEDLKVAIPEGEPGLNPGGISRSEKIEIVFDFGVFE